jgi:hypothetical protein
VGRRKSRYLGGRSGNSPFIEESLGPNPSETSAVSPRRKRSDKSKSTVTTEFDVWNAENPITSIIDTLGHEYGWTVEQILDMPKDQVFACLDAIGNRYGREAAAYEKDKDPNTVNFADVDGDDAKLQALGINVVKS